MLRRKFRTIAVSLLAVLFVGDPDCYAALASKLGKKRFTAKLSSNRVIRRQQLIVDPEGILGGSASVRYNPELVRLVDVIDPGDFEIRGGFVGFTSTSIGRLTSDLLPLESFLNPTDNLPPPGDPGATTGGFETGYVQVFFGRRESDALRAADASPAGGSVIPNLPGYVTVDEDGPTGINDTHALIFEYLPNVRPTTEVPYAVFATPPRLGTVSDFIIPEDDPENVIPYTELGGAEVSGPLLVLEDGGDAQVIPLPPAALSGLAGLTGVAGLLAWRRRRAAAF